MADKAVAIDSNEPLPNTAVAVAARWAGDYERAFAAGNYETALAFRERILLARDTDIGRAWLAATLGHLGEIAEARQAWSELLTINPSFSIEPRLSRFVYVRPEDPERAMAGLSKAGLPPRS